MVAGSSPFDFGRLLEPKTIAVFGASPDERRFGGRPLHNLVKHHFPGSLLPVNPKYQEIGGIRCYPDLISSGRSADLALVAVPADAVPKVVNDCVRSGVRMAVIFSAGFAEADALGRERQASIVQMARAGGMRLMGPNCLGFLNAEHRVAAVATGALEQPDIPSGRISLVSQSGAMGFVGVFNRAYDAGVGFRYAAAVGNEADVNVLDFLEWFAVDPETRVIAALLEGVRAPRRFLEFAEAAAKQRRPVVVLKSGRSAEARAAATAHTAAVAGRDEIHDAIFNRFGIVRVDDIDELWQVSNLLDRQDLPTGNRVAVISTSGGFNGIIADHLKSRGLELPPLSDKTIRGLERKVPPYGSLRNPIDLTGQFAGRADEAHIFDYALNLLDNDPVVDMIVLVQVVVRREYSDVAVPLVDTLGAIKKPVVVVAPGGEISETGLRPLWRSGIPLFRSAGSAAVALSAMARYGQYAWKGPRPYGPGSRRSARRLPARTLGYAETIELLERFNIPVARHELASTQSDAKAAASRIGYPIALKCVGTDFPHKSELGVIRLNVGPHDFDRVFLEVEEAAASAQLVPEGFVVQEMVHGPECLLGIQNDEQFGPCLAVGAGGIMAELLGGVVLEPLPISKDLAESALSRSGIAAQLGGYRGQPQHDVKALVDLMVRLGDLARECGWSLSALDLNPVVVGVEGEGVTVVDALVVGRQ